MFWRADVVKDDRKLAFRQFLNNGERHFGDNRSQSRDAPPDH